MINYFSLAIQNYANFSGRSRRKEFWFFVLGMTIINAFLARFYGEHNWVAQVAEILLFIPMLAVAARRLHDQGHSAGWLFIALTGIGIIPLFFMMMAEGQPGANQYGPDPKLDDPYDTEVRNAYQQRNPSANEWYHQDLDRRQRKPVARPVGRVMEDDLV